MENETKKVSGAFLRQCIWGIKRARRGDFSQEKYAKQQSIESKADSCLESYMEGTLYVEPKNQRLFARFIQEFGYSQQQRAAWLDKLQSEADFDVRKYLETQSVSWWRRIFPKNDVLTAKKMQKKIAKANSLVKKVQKKKFFDGLKYAEKLRSLEEEAEEYIEAYNKGNFVPENARVFAAYVNTLGNFYTNSPAEQALDKLRETPVVEPQKEVKIKSNRKFSFIRGLKYAAVGTFVAVIGWLGFKSNTTKKDAEKPATEIKATPVIGHNDNTAGLDVWQSFAQKHASDVNSSDKQVKQNVSAQKADHTGQQQADMNDFYVSRLVKFTSANSAQKRIDDFSARVASGTVSLPKDISIARFLYTEQIYRKYGFKSIANELNLAINADKRVAKDEQEKLFEFIRAAGYKGEGVQKMSQQPTLVDSLMNNQDIAAVKDNNVSFNQEEMNDFYAKRLTQFTSKNRAQKMINEFSQKVDAGIISLPEDISVNRFLYTQQIYKRYGFKEIESEFQSAVKADKKVSEAKQKKLFGYVREAGDKGVGVRKKVIRLNYKNLKELRDSRRR